MQTNAASCAPAEWPMTSRRSGSPPYSAMWSCTQRIDFATARRCCTENAGQSRSHRSADLHDPVAVRHTQVGHDVQGTSPDGSLRHLALRPPAGQMTAEDRLHPEDSRLGQRPDVIAALPLPRLAARSPDLPQVLVT